MVRRGTFRDGSYSKNVFWGKRTVKKGECLSVWYLSGKQEIIEGPKRKKLYSCNIRFLDRHQADQKQFLMIQHRDGRKEHVRGPVAMFEDPVVHSHVEVREIISIDAFEALVVYSEEADGVSKIGKVQRSVIRGPTMFMPEANEWVHEFVWHGTEPNKKAHVIPGASKFTKLKTIPDQLYYNVEVRTADDIVLTAKLMVFYEIRDVERMLETTSDPIGDLINVLVADMITFAAKVSYEKFVEVSANCLNDMTTFPLLVQRSSQIGFEVNKVAYRGYNASAELQAMKDQEVKKNANLNFEHESAMKQQELEDLKIQRAQVRADKERQMAAAEHQERIRQKQLEHELALKIEQESLMVQEAAQQRKNAEQLKFLGTLQSMGVNLTQYLTSENSKVDKLIRIENSSGAIPVVVSGK